jgi:hypothetical protein
LLLQACGGGDGGPVKTAMAPSESHILKIVTVWTEYKKDHRNKPPTSLDELKAYAKKLSKDKQKQLGIEDPDKMFTSPRDNQPYGLNRVGTEMGGMNKILFYEKVGVNGLRMTASTMGTVAEVDETEFRRWVR